MLTAVRELTAEQAGELTVSMIVARAGISRSSFYSHFSSLSDLAESLMIDAMDASEQEMRRALSGATTADTIRTAFEVMRDHFTQHRDLYRSILEMPGSARAYRGAVAALTRINRDFLRSLPSIPEGVDPETVAVSIAWAHYGTYDSWLRGDLDVPPELLVDSLFESLPEWFREPARISLR